MKNITYIFLLNIFMFTVGCGTLYNLTEDAHDRRERRAGLDPLHIHSCGPTAMEKAHELYGGSVDRVLISKELQDKGNFLRSFLSVFSHNARSITFPGEIIEYFESRNFTINKIKDFKDLKKNDVALILVKKKYSISYHWMCYPVDLNIFTFYGRGSTVITDIYLIKPPPKTT